MVNCLDPTHWTLCKALWFSEFIIGFRYFWLTIHLHLKSFRFFHGWRQSTKLWRRTSCEQVKISKLSKHLTKLDQIIDLQPLVQEISINDKTDVNTGGRPRKNPLWMIKTTFLQSLLSLSNPHLEKQLIDLLSFQRFVGIDLDREIPDFTTFWRFKEALSTYNLDERIFELINQQLEAKGRMVKKGTIVDTSILPSSARPLSDKNLVRNRLRFVFACIEWNLSRAGFLLEKTNSRGSVVL